MEPNLRVDPLVLARWTPTINPNRIPYQLRVLPKRRPYREPDTGIPSENTFHKECLSMTRLLLSLGAKVNIADDMGYTPICVAAEKGNIQLVRYLAKRKAKINVQTNMGTTPIYLATRKLHRQTAFTLKNLKAGMTDRDIIHACINERPPVLEMMKELKVDFTKLIGMCETSLHWAAWAGNVDSANWLLDNNIFHVDVRRSCLSTPLHWAAWRGHLEMCKLLLRRGADANSVNIHGYTPWNMAKSRGLTNVANLFKSFGAIPAPISLAEEDDLDYEE